ERIKSALKSMGDSPLIHEALLESDAEMGRLRIRRCQLQNVNQIERPLPQSIVELHHIFENHAAELAVTSAQFSELLRRLITRFDVFLVRACDGGHPTPRAYVRLMLDGLSPDLRNVEGIPELLTRDFTIDLFTPPQRVRIRTQCAALAMH